MGTIGTIYAMGFIDNMIKAFNNNLWNWINTIAIIAGLIMMLAGIIKIAKGLMSHGQGQVNWVINILLLVVGGLMTFGGFSQVAGFAQNVGNDVLGLQSPTASTPTT